MGIASENNVTTQRWSPIGGNEVLWGIFEESGMRAGGCTTASRNAPRSQISESGHNVNWRSLIGYIWMAHCGKGIPLALFLVWHPTEQIDVWACSMRRRLSRCARLHHLPHQCSILAPQLWCACAMLFSSCYFEQCFDSSAAALQFFSIDRLQKFLCLNIAPYKVPCQNCFSSKHNKLNTWLANFLSMFHSRLSWLFHLVHSTKPFRLRIRNSIQKSKEHIWPKGDS